MDKLPNEFSENDIERIFAGKKKNPRFSIYLLYSGLTIILVALIFVVINGPSYVTRINYWYKSDFSPSQGNDGAIGPDPGISNAGSLTDNSIDIERIGIKAPITWDVLNSPDITAKALENGTIHLAGTAHPGEIGNVFVTGHSSNYIWAPGNYKTVFALLNKIVIGDKVYIEYQQKLFTYQVTDISTIKPTDLSVLTQGKVSTLSLVTCTPVGTSLNRLVVRAIQISPDPATNKKNSNLTNNKSLPSTR